MFDANVTKYAVYSKGVLVGYSRLEKGDAPMGVAFGEFEPSEAYAGIKHECAANHVDQSRLEFSVRTETGTVIPCAGVGILDYSAEADSPYIELNILGIPYPLYGELFSQHVTEYERQFSNLRGKHHDS